MPTSPHLPAIIIDFDDTLCMSEQACFELENEVLRRMGREPQSREIHRKTWGMQIEQAMPIRSPGVDMVKYLQLVQPIHQEFVANGHIDQIPAENLTALDTLAQRGHQLFILTSRTLAEATHLLDPEHHLAGRITEIYHANNTTHIKPDPRVFDVLLEKYNLQTDDCVYVGDSPSDSLAAKGAGMHFVASFESGLRTTSDFNNVVIDAAIYHFTELPEAMQILQTKNAA
jgi:phosphoglycolate phosphatase